MTKHNAGRRAAAPMFPIVVDYLALKAKHAAALTAKKYERASVLRAKMESLHGAMTAAAQRQLSRRRA